MIHGYPVLILGAGLGGSALLEMFIEDELVDVVGIVDSNQAAPGIALAKAHGIPVYSDAIEALKVSKNFPDCIVYNLTHDDAISEEARKILGNDKVTGGVEAKLFWQMVTNLKQTKDKLLEIQEELTAVIQHAIDGIISISESGEIQGFNPAAEMIFGYSRQDVLGKHVNILIPEPGAQESRSDATAGLAWISGVRGREVTAIRASGEQFPLELSASDMMLHGQRYFVGIVRDITDRKLAEQKIMHLAHHDQLTGLPNRVLFFDRLKQAIHLARRNSQNEAVMFLDLDGFKPINDTLGHDAGDLLLQQVAHRLQRMVRPSDTIARVGGDEFIFVLNNIGEYANAALIARKIIAALSEPFDLNGHQRKIGGSIGIAVFPDDSTDFETLLKQADEAMYRAKQRGKNTYQFYRDMLA